MRWFSFWKKKSAIAHITDRTRVADLVSHYPNFATFLHTQLGLQITSNDLRLRFGEWCRRSALPPAQVVFMQFQMSERTGARTIEASALQARMQTDPKLVVLDARESWEYEWAKLPNTSALNAQTLPEILKMYPRDTPLAVICHFGIRSMDAAAYLSDQGFTDVTALEGGLEAWSLKADPTFPRYPGHPC